RRCWLAGVSGDSRKQRAGAGDRSGGRVSGARRRGGRLAYAPGSGPIASGIGHAPPVTPYLAFTPVLVAETAPASGDHPSRSSRNGRSGGGAGRCGHRPGRPGGRVADRRIHRVGSAGAAPAPAPTGARRCPGRPAGAVGGGGQQPARGPAPDGRVGGRGGGDQPAPPTIGCIKPSRQLEPSRNRKRPHRRAVRTASSRSATGRADRRSPCGRIGADRSGWSQRRSGPGHVRQADRRGAGHPLVSCRIAAGRSRPGVRDRSGPAGGAAAYAPRGGVRGDRDRTATGWPGVVGADHPTRSPATDLTGGSVSDVVISLGLAAASAAAVLLVTTASRLMGWSGQRRRRMAPPESGAGASSTGATTMRSGGERTSAIRAGHRRLVAGLVGVAVALGLGGGVGLVLGLGAAVVCDRAIHRWGRGRTPVAAPGAADLP